jgi:hypothetical protein
LHYYCAPQDDSTKKLGQHSLALKKINLSPEERERGHEARHDEILAGFLFAGIKIQSGNYH